MVEVYVMMSFCKNVFVFVMIFYVNNWIVVQGVKEIFYVVGGIIIVVSFMMILMYIYGKCVCSFVYWYGLMVEVVNDSVDESKWEGRG